MRTKTMRGFTLIEMVIVVAIIGIIAAVTIPAMVGASQNAKLRGAARHTLGHVIRARQLAATGKGGGWANNEKTLNAGIIINPGGNGYTVFIDRDNQQDGDEVPDAIVDFPSVPDTQYLRIVAPAAGSEIRFRRNGTLNTPNDQVITLRDTETGRQENITVFFGGTARID